MTSQNFWRILQSKYNREQSSYFSRKHGCYYEILHLIFDVKCLIFLDYVSFVLYQNNFIRCPSALNRGFLHNVAFPLFLLFSPCGNSRLHLVTLTVIEFSLYVFLQPPPESASCFYSHIPGVQQSVKYFVAGCQHWYNKTLASEQLRS